MSCNQQKRMNVLNVIKRNKVVLMKNILRVIISRWVRFWIFKNYSALSYIKNEYILITIMIRNILL